MKAKDALIIWDEANSGRATAGQCRVMRHGQQDDRRFPFSYTGPQNFFAGVHDMTADERLTELLLMYVRLVLLYGLDPSRVAEEFCKIDEFRDGFALDRSNNIPIALRRHLRTHNEFFGIEDLEDCIED
jgi:hypothetical protein